MTRLRFLQHGLPVLAAAMLAFGIWSVIHADERREVLDPPIAPPRSPYAATIAGTGIVEPSSETIAVATELGGVVTRVHVRAGDRVAAGQPLFAIDDRGYRAALDQAQATLDAAAAAIASYDSRLALQRSLIEQAAASVAGAEAEYERALADRGRYSRLAASDWATAQRLETAAADARKAEAALAGQRAALASARQEVAVLTAGRTEAEAQLDAARAALAQARIALDKTVVSAPIDGTILRVGIRLGEYAEPGVLSEPLMTMGAVETLHVRVEIDETDSWRLRDGAAAVLQLRGNPAAGAELRLVRIEPTVVPKRSLRNGTGERVDTRVLQAIYSFDPAAVPARVGQQVDVFIDAADRAPPAPSSAPTAWRRAGEGNAAL